MIPPAMEYPPDIPTAQPSPLVDSSINLPLGSRDPSRALGVQLGQKNHPKAALGFVLELRGRSDLSSPLPQAQRVHLGVLGTGKLRKELLQRNLRDFSSQKGFRQQNEVGLGGGSWAGGSQAGD